MGSKLLAFALAVATWWMTTEATQQKEWVEQCSMVIAKQAHWYAEREATARSSSQEDTQPSYTD